MRHIQFLDFETPYSGALGKIDFDPFLAAVASLKTADGLPLVSHWIDPFPDLSIIEEGRLRVRDAITNAIHQSISTGNPLPEKTNNISGQSTFSLSQPMGILNSSVVGSDVVSVNKNEWSLISVCNLLENNGTANNNQRIFGLGSGTLGEGNLFPVLEVHGDAGTIAIREGGTTERRVFSAVGGTLGQPVIVGGAFSVDQGVSVFKNDLIGLERNEEDARPLTQPDFTFMADRGGSNPALGDFGMAFVLRADITKPEYSAARKILIRGLMAKYGINPG